MEPLSTHDQEFPMIRPLAVLLASALMFATFNSQAATAPAAAAKPAATAPASKTVSAAPGTASVKPAKATTRCRDAKGKFAACPKTVAAKTKPVQCRDSKGKFVACASK